MAVGAAVEAARDGRFGHGAQLAERALRHPTAPLVDPELFPFGARAAQHFLLKAGFESHVVGAGVRDFLLLGKAVAPVEILTAAPNEVLVAAQALAEEVRVRAGDPDQLMAYLGRSDFTVCAVAVNLLTGAVLDPYNGVQAARDRVLVTVRDASLHLREQPAAAVRALRHQASYGLTLETSLRDALASLAARYGRGGTDEAHRRRLVVELFRAVRLDPRGASRFLELMAEERIADHGVGSVLGVALPELAQALHNEAEVELYPGGTSVTVPAALRPVLWAQLVGITPREGRYRRAAALLMPLARAHAPVEPGLVGRVLRDSGYISAQQVNLVTQVLEVIATDHGRRGFEELRGLVAASSVEVVRTAVSLLEARDVAVRAALGLPEHVGPSRAEVFEAAVAEPDPDDDAPPLDRPDEDISGFAPEDVEPDAVIPPSPVSDDGARNPDSSSMRPPEDDAPTVPFEKLGPEWKLPVSLQELRAALRLDLAEDSVVCRSLHTYAEGGTMTVDAENVVEYARTLAEQQGLVKVELPGAARWDKMLDDLGVHGHVAEAAKRKVFWLLRTGKLEDDALKVEEALLEASMQ
jgi:hypothetical protein